MKSFLSQTKQTYVLEVNWLDRWQVYQRLQELDIPCWCQANEPLKVEITSPVAAIQLWSVMQQFTASRQTLISLLKLNWQSH
ncbi:MAG: Asr1405/Asl0597 family protein [Trichormus sp.]